MTTRSLNAIKHGMFSKIVILPGEDASEFDALLQSVIEELDPQGPIEYDKVLSIAQNLWRKDRLRRQKREKIAIKVRDRAEKQRDENAQLEVLQPLLEILRSGSPLSEEEFLAKAPQFWQPHFKRLAPRHLYETEDLWREAITEQVGGAVYVLIERRNQSTRFNEYFDEKEMEKDLAIEERLDAKIDKDVVSFGRAKTMQQMGLGRRQEPLVDVTPDNASKQIELQAAPIESPPITGGDSNT